MTHTSTEQTDRYENIRRALSMGPTPGPWEPVTDRPYSDLPYLVLGAGASDAKSAEWVPLYVHVGGRSGWMEQKANTLLIAACDPDTIRALLAERDDALEARLRAAQAEAAAGDARDREDAERYRLLRRKVCIAGGEFHILNLDPRYIAPDAAVELDAAIDAALAAAPQPPEQIQPLCCIPEIQTTGCKEGATSEVHEIASAAVHANLGLYRKVMAERAAVAAACNPSMQPELATQSPESNSHEFDGIKAEDDAKRAALSAGPGIQKAVQALIDAAILEGGSPPPSQEAAMQATEQRKADLLKLLEPFIGTPLNE